VAIEAACQQATFAELRDSDFEDGDGTVDGLSLNLPPLFGRTSTRLRDAIKMSPFFAAAPSRASA
jgi:hypothetical protein